MKAFLVEVETQREQHPGFLDFTGFVFPVKVMFSFDLPEVYFNNVTFSDGCFFGRSKQYSGGVNFIDQDPDLTDSIVFKKKALFNNTTFGGYAWFDGAKFSGYARFSNATFTGDAGFSNAKFSGDAWFDGATFTGYARFSNAKFSGDAWFGGAKFTGDAGFSNAKFSGDAWFDGATFTGYAWFGGAMFTGYAWFGGAKFSGDAGFSNATFEGTADFRNTTIIHADYTQTRFNGMALFTQITITETANFNFSSFNEHLILTQNPQYPQKDTPLLSFLSVSFQKPNLVMISGIDLARTSFLMTDVSNILLIPTPSTSQIHDETLLNKKPKTLLNNQKPGENKSENPSPEEEKTEAIREELTPYINQQTVQLEYKLIRKSLENSRRYNESAPLYIREMTHASKELKWSRNSDEKLVHAGYRLVSDYGESIWKPLYVAIITIILFAEFFLFVCLKDDSRDLGQLLWALSETASVFLQIRSFKDLTLLKDTPIIYEILLRLLSLCLLGNIYIALRRRFERK